MKNTLLFILIISTFGLKAQTGYVISGSNLSEMRFLQNLYVPVTNWYTIDTLNAGSDTCTHEWYSSIPYSYSNGFGRGYSISCAVVHAPGTRCSWTIQTRKSICSKCYRHIAEQDEDPNPKPEVPIVPVETYETILERLNKKE
mgnify:CR=1